VHIGVSVVAVVVKTESLALTVVVSLCQCREMYVKLEQIVANKFCCKVKKDECSGRPTKSRSDEKTFNVSKWSKKIET
jgi:hypothetical protein